MPITKEEVSKRVKVKLPVDLDDDEMEDLLSEIGDYVVTSMLDYLGDGRSPVNGDQFEKLNSKYANRSKGGDRTANMELNGDLLDALDFEIKDGELFVGFFDDDQAIKAYGHQTGMKGHPWLAGVTPKRKLVPGASEDFDDRIMDGIDSIIEDFIDGRED